MDTSGKYNTVKEGDRVFIPASENSPISGGFAEVINFHVS